MIRTTFTNILAGFALVLSTSSVALAQSPANVLPRLLSQPALRRASQSSLQTFGSGAAAAAEFSGLQQQSASGKDGSRAASMYTSDRMIPLLINGIASDGRAFAAGIEIFNNSDYTQDVQIEFFGQDGTYQAMPLGALDGTYLGTYEAARLTLPANGRRAFITYPVDEPLQLGYARVRRSKSSTTVEVAVHQAMQTAVGYNFTVSHSIADASNLQVRKYMVDNEYGSELAVTVTDSSSTSDVYTHVRARNDNGQLLCEVILNTYKDNMAAATLNSNACFAAIEGPYVLELESNHSGLHAAALYASESQGMVMLRAIPGEN